LAALVVLTFYAVSGGPFGIEAVVQAGGPLIALAGFSLMLVWSLPEALITAELSTAMPEASGSVAWVDAAFGEFWAFQKGWLSWLSGVADNALYPILFLDCLLALFQDCRDASSSPLASPSYESSSSCHLVSQLSDETSPLRLLFIAAITLALTYLNYRGLDIVGSLAIVICVLSLLPFVVFCAVGLPQVQPHRWLQMPDRGLAGVNWRLLLNTFFWNVNYWESASSFAGDVAEPSTAYPRGMLLAVGLVFVSLFLPVLVGTGASSEPYTQWTDGYFVHLASEIAGPWLALWMMFAATLTNVGMFEAEMTSDAWQVAGMAEHGILPKILATRNKHGTPTYGVLLSASGVIVLSCMSFSQVIDMLNLLYCYGQVIEFAAFLHLRRTRPDMHRPYRVPLGYKGMCVVLAFPLVFIGVILYFSSTMALALSSLLGLAGTGVWWMLKKARRQGWCEFYDEDGLY